MKRALIITYYWPPSGGSGVQRWLKFSKYLPYYDWQPVIYTPENPEHPVIDESLEKDIPEEAVVIKQKIFEPYGFFRRLVGLSKDYKVGISQILDHKDKGFLWNLSVWIRGNLFIPDPRILWIKPSVKFLTEYIERNPVDVIITTGPPHSMHLIGKRLKEKTGLKWIADLRDPWSRIDYLKEMKMTRMAKKRQENMERRVLCAADGVITVSPTWAEDLEELTGRKVEVIYNGFDPEDFEKHVAADNGDKFRILYSGNLSKFQYSKDFFDTLEQLCIENEDFRNDLQLDFYGAVDPKAEKDILAYEHVGKKYNFHGYVSHETVIRQYHKASLLLIIMNDTENSRGVIPAKGFEYMASGRPVLAIGPEDCDFAKILRKTGAGMDAGFKDIIAMRNGVIKIYKDSGKKSEDFKKQEVEKFSRKELAGKLVQFLENIT